VEEAQPRIRSAFDELLFRAIDGLERTSDTPGASCFDLDEQQEFPSSSNDIDLSPLGCAVIAIEDFFPLGAEPLAGDTFAEIADLLRRPGMAIRVSQMAARVEQPAETSDGECDKVREDGAHGGAVSYHIRCADQSHIVEILGRILACSDRVRPSQ